MNRGRTTRPVAARRRGATAVRAAALLALAAGLAACGAAAPRTGPSAAGAPTPSGTAPPATTAGGGPTAAPGTTGPVGGTGGGGVTRCHTAGLRLSAGPGGAAAGNVYHALAFTNVSGHTCRMYGFPGMAPVDAHGTWITDVRTRREALTPKLITLKPGATAWATIHWGVVDGTYHGAACDPGAAGLVVTPPDETTQLHLTLRMVVCGYGEIWTGPVTDQRPTHG